MVQWMPRNYHAGVVSLLFVGGCLLSGSAAAGQGPLFELLERMELSYANVRDYTAVFSRRERIDGEWRAEETGFLKFQRPFKVYMRWLAGPPQGREALYVEGARGNKVMIHEAHGLASFFSFLLDPGSRRILKDSRYPFTEIGIGRLIERVGTAAKRAWARGELQLVDRGRAKIKGRDVWQVEGILPRDRSSEYDYYRTILSIDQGNGLPIHALIYDWDNVVTGEYTYTELELNPGLGEFDFDPANSTYNFPRWRISLGDGE